MKYLQVTLRHSAETIHPMHEFVCDHGGYDEYHLVNWNFATPDANTLLFHVHGPREPYEATLREVEGVQSFEVAPLGDDRFYVYVMDDPDETGQGLMAAFSRPSIAAVPPLSYRMDRSVSIGVLGEPDRLREVFEATPDDIRVDIERVGEYAADPAAAGARLTDRQREAVRVAQALGYYEVPREATVADVADELDCSTGTAAEHLQKAAAELLGDLDC
ncbi:helix-turn-helix domain-containing protein [Haloarchaeobius salinus]|uniref:helix-turn-helix domain-containing protein n=1 Tax=Haloarchaeobius salinus TaxID=1198298 RepID=UPI002108F399|nr:helix-turn-helix domain-containing protein [Haloarchaeobius salinus]